MRVSKLVSYRFIDSVCSGLERAFRSRTVKDTRKPERRASAYREHVSIPEQRASFTIRSPRIEFNDFLEHRPANISIAIIAPSLALPLGDSIELYSACPRTSGKEPMNIAILSYANFQLHAYICTYVCRYEYSDHRDLV